MTVIRTEARVDDDTRRQGLYGGEVHAYAPRPGTKALCDLARELSEEAFHPFDPQLAQHELPVERYAEILAELKPRFIHHPESKRLIQEILREFECDPEKTCFDVPRLRTSTSGGYLTTGIAFAFHPHRDTWYSAPACQLNWWMPVYELADNGLEFYPRYWSEPVANGSAGYNYQEWVENNRFNAAVHVYGDTRVQPRPEQPLDLSGAFRVVSEPGGVTLFAAAQLHGSVPNASGRTRLSIDFRTVHLDDVAARRGAPNIDSECTGTTMGDYLRCSDLTHVPEDLIREYERDATGPLRRSLHQTSDSGH